DQPVYKLAERARDQDKRALEAAQKKQCELKDGLEKKKEALRKIIASHEKILRDALATNTLLAQLEEADKKLNKAQEHVQALKNQHADAIKERERMAQLKEGAEQRKDDVDKALANANLGRALEREKAAESELCQARCDLTTAQDGRREAADK